MPPKKAVAEGATTRAQSSQGQSISDEVNDTEDLTSDVPALVAALTGHAMGDEIDQSNEHTEGRTRHCQTSGFIGYIRPR